MSTTFWIFIHENFNIYSKIQNDMHNMQLIMLTLGTGDVVFDTAQKEDVMSCLESAIKNSLRSVDVSTRFSSEEFLIVLLNAEENDVQTITNRVFEKFYKMYDGKGVQLSYDIANLSKMEWSR